MNKKTYSAREAEKILKRNGWCLARTSGGHKTYKKRGIAGLITINHNLHRNTFLSLVQMYNLEV